MIEINKCKLVPGITSNWGDILGDITKQQDLVDYIDTHGGGNAEWGSITGDLSDQEDLMTLLDEYAKKDWVESQGYLVQSDLSQYATRQWVTGRGYATEHWVSNDYTNNVVTPAQEKAEENVKDWVVEEGYINQIKTVNNQSLVGTGNIEISGLTPAQEDAIDPLMNASGGVLYTEELEYKGQVWKKIEFMYNEYLHQIKDDVYMFQSGSLYRFDTEILDFVKVSSFNSWGNRWLWEDNSGRLYDGYNYQLDIDTGTTIEVDTEGYEMTKYYSSSKMNLLYGQYGIWLLSSSNLKRFDETTQKFVSGFELKLPDGFNESDEMFSCLFEYDGHNLLYLYGTTYEFVEYEESINVSDVTGTYFTTPTDSVQPYNIFTLSDGGLYYVGSNRRVYKYNETSNVWSLYKRFTYTLTDRKAMTGGLVIGGNSNYSPYKYMITNFGESIRLTSWIKVSDIAVDLDSDQTIEGQKTFNTIYSDSISINGLYARGGTTIFNLANNTTSATKIEITSGAMMLNGNSVATTDQLILNRTKLPYGGYKRNVLEQNGLGPYAYNYFKTHTGRLFYFDDGGYRYEWDGSSLINQTQVFTVRPYNVFGSRVIVTPNDTFYDEGNSTYLWDDTNSDFVRICDGISSGEWTEWWDGSNLRTQEYKLVNNGSTWEWVSDPINDYKTGMYHYVNSKVYCLSTNDSVVYEYDPTNKTYEVLGYWNQWTSQCSFVAGGDIIFPYNGSTWMKIDFSKVVQSGDSFITSDTSIPWNDMYDNMHYEYNGELLYTSWNNIWACWGMEEEFPEVPVTNGTYVLQATRVGDTITYEWVPDNVL